MCRNILYKWELNSNSQGYYVVEWSPGHLRPPCTLATEGLSVIWWGSPGPSAAWNGERYAPCIKSHILTAISWWCTCNCLENFIHFKECKFPPLCKLCRTYLNECDIILNLQSELLYASLFRTVSTVHTRMRTTTAGRVSWSSSQWSTLVLASTTSSCPSGPTSSVGTPSVLSSCFWRIGTEDIMIPSFCSGMIAKEIKALKMIKHTDLEWKLWNFKTQFHIFHIRSP